MGNPDGEKIEYDDNGISITSPGKFAGCDRWVPMMWDMGLNGYGEVGEDYTVLAVSELDVKRFPELEGVDKVRMHEDDNGFIHEETHWEGSWWK